MNSIILIAALAALITFHIIKDMPWFHRFSAWLFLETRVGQGIFNAIKQGLIGVTRGLAWVYAELHKARQQGYEWLIMLAMLTIAALLVVVAVSAF